MDTLERSRTRGDRPPFANGRPKRAMDKGTSNRPVPSWQPVTGTPGVHSWEINPQTNIVTRVDARGFCVSSMDANRPSLLVLTFEHDNLLSVLPLKNGGSYLGNADLMLGGEAESSRARRIPSRNTNYIKHMTKAYRKRLAERCRQGLLPWFQCGICGQLSLDPAGSLEGGRPICFDCLAVADRIALAKECHDGRL